MKESFESIIRSEIANKSLLKRGKISRSEFERRHRENDRKWRELAFKRGHPVGSKL